PATPPSAAASAAPAATPEPQGPDRPLNVLLILVDSMRADMPWAGYPRDIAPNLTQLERESVSYSRAYSVSSYTAKSVAALLSGQYPSSLKRSGFFFTHYPDSNLFFPELLAQAGVHTIATHGHMYMAPGKNGMDQGFADWQVVGGIKFDNTKDDFVTSDKMTALGISQLEAAPKGKPFFMYMHYMDPHDVYVRHPESPDFGKSSRDRYDGEIFYTDLWIGKLLDYCRQQPWWNKTAVIVSADHGEAFGEHKMYRHAFALWNALTHVPLFVHLPGGVAPRRIDTPRSDIDLAPTILDLMGVEGDPVFAGKTLVPELYGADAPARPVLLDLPVDSNNPEVRAMIDGTMKLIVYGRDYRFELYDLAADPGETTDLSKRQPERLEAMKQLYRELWSKVPAIRPYGGNRLIDGSPANGPSK
ncbi:MAG: sulfatase, partial [Sorangiineae bacterium]|nr:sulfatase [Sorangiineae bacterium]